MIRMFTCWLGLLVLISTQVEAISIYRNPMSPFPSGDLSIDKLGPSTQKIISKNWQKVEWKDSAGWIRTSLTYNYMHFCKKMMSSKSLPLRSEPQWHLNPKASIPQGAEVQLILIDEDWGLVKFKDKDKFTEGWTELSGLIPKENDIGYAYPKQKLALKTEASDSSKTLTFIPLNSRLEPLLVTEDWVKVNFNNQLGFVRATDILSKIDFATEILTNNGHWQKLQFALGAWIKTENDYIHLNQVTGIRMRQDLLFISKSQVNLHATPSFDKAPIAQLSYLQTLVQLEQKTQKWVLSQYNNQELWWKLNEANGSEEQKGRRLASHNSLLTKDLFSRKIFSIATSPIIPNLMFASAGGIFRSTDGEHWTAVKQFESENHPLAISPSGTIYVGPYRSTDQGQSFKQFIRWDLLTQAIQQNYAKVPQHVRIVSIEVSDHDGKALTLTVDTGWSKVKLVSHNSGQTWSSH